MVNAHSRRGMDLFDEAKAKLEKAGLHLRAAHAVGQPGELNGVVRAVVAEGAPMVIVGGGDGSLSGCVDELVATGCVFAVLPLGTANSFARTLGIPLDLDGAVEVIASGEARRIDLGMINDDYFVNAAALGLSPMIAESVPHKLKRYFGRLGYLLWALRCAMSFRPFRLEIECEGRTRRLWSTEVRILNGKYHGGVKLSDTADVESGEIVIQAVVGRSRLRLALDWYAKSFRLADRNAHTEEFHGQAFRLATRPSLSVSVDGEVLARTPLEVKIAHKAIHVAAPRPAADDAGQAGRIV